MSSPTPHRYPENRWELGDVFGWIIDRDELRFGRVLTPDDWMRASYSNAVHPRADLSPTRYRARTNLLEALRNGDLVARDLNGNKVKSDFWLPKREVDLSDLGRAYVFRRDEVLKLWPRDDGALTPQSRTSSRPPSRRKPFWDGADGAESAVMKWLEDEGCPLHGDGNQAKLEGFTAAWLAERGHEATLPTIRRHVRDCIQRQKKILIGTR
jgi:hypothetical protein